MPRGSLKLLDGSNIGLSRTVRAPIALRRRMLFRMGEKATVYAYLSVVSIVAFIESSNIQSNMPVIYREAWSVTNIKRTSKETCR